MKEPPLNSSHEARELRRLAQEWVNHPDTMNSSDKSAREVERLNAKLLKAAIAYADAVREENYRQTMGLTPKDPQ